MTTNTDDRAIMDQAVEIAETWQKRANELVTKDEKSVQQMMMRLLRNPMDKVVLTKMIDQSFRATSTKRVADQVSYVMNKFGVPKFFSTPEKALMNIFLAVGQHVSMISIPQMIKKIRQDSSRSIIPGELDLLHAHLKKRKQEEVRMNLNHLGEAVLGEEEAADRLDTYIKDMEDPEIEYISVKISTIYSQISSLAFDHTIEVLKDRLSKLYKFAKNNYYVHNDGTKTPKFVNLDMEEYRDLEITVEAFTQTLDQPEFKDYAAGIVLQAYMPDSFEVQKTLTDWAKKRVADGGAPIKLRIVKGANMEMELVESSIFNWPLAPYDNKLEVDANYKRMVRFGMKPENVVAVNLGIASHNLFELAYAYCLGREYKVTDHFNFEMLEGMADHIRRAIQEISGEVLLYAPVASKDQFINAIAYLIRRLDENTSPENFLRYSFNLTSDSKEWAFLKDQFIQSCEYIDSAKNSPNRIQDRNTETFPEQMGTYWENDFVNEPDTDWSLATSRKWAESIRDRWMKKGNDEDCLEIPVVVAGKELKEDRKQKEYTDPNFTERVLTARYTLGDNNDADRAVETARNDPDGWRAMSYKQRHEILSRAAALMRAARGDLIGSAAANTGKIFSEADPEVSEAIDFIEFYPWSAKTFSEMENVTASGKGVGLVISPWNFPIAIPCGGVAASLAAGNTVIFKPASDSVLPAWILCNCLWDAGVSKNTLQFLPCSGSSTGARLADHPDVDYIILTGGTDTGLAILDKRPSVLLAAETGGKNSTIVTAMSDRDQAIKNVLHSAFGNCGQKCSATSLLILEKEVYEDENFKKQLLDAVKSYKIGSAWKFESKMGPLIHPPKGDLERCMTRLEPGETWLLEPEMLDDNPYLWTPGIKWGVRPGSYTHMTEFFGPVLGVMLARDLDHAIRLVNQPGYGLTSGIESLDQREQEYWKDRIEAGNLYINRGTTGAIVLRQPFGGMRKSALGAGIKAGGPNYVAQLMDFVETGMPKTGAISKNYPLLSMAAEWTRKLYWGVFDEDIAEDIQKTIRAIKSYLYHVEQEFFQEKDYFNLRGQDNIVRYLPVGKVLVRVHEDDSLFDVLARIAAVKISGNQLILSLPDELDNEVTVFLSTHEGRQIIDEDEKAFHTDRELVRIMPEIDRIRYASSAAVPDKVFEEAAKTGFYISRTSVMMEGRIELLQYFKEQAICNNYHRYGNLGERGLI